MRLLRVIIREKERVLPMQHFQARLFFAYLLLTIVLELPVLFAAVRRIYKIPATEIGGASLLLCGFLCSFATYPYVWYVFPALIADERMSLAVAETVVILIESLIIMGMLKLSYARALMVSVLCNVTTIVLGSLMNHLILEYKLFVI